MKLLFKSKTCINQKYTKIKSIFPKKFDNLNTLYGYICRYTDMYIQINFY